MRFHVVHSGRYGRLSKKALRRQIATLNAAYSGRKGGADTRVRFRLSGYDRTNKPSWFYHPQHYEHAMKRRLRKGGRGTLNVYTASVGAEVLGFSTFPQWYRRDPRMDGVVVDYRSLPRGSYAPFNHGYTGVHEIGHWLGLMHTFEGGCTPPGTGWPTPRTRRCPRKDARATATRARSGAVIRCTTSWTTPTTPACGASPQVRGVSSGRRGRRTGPAGTAATVWIRAQQGRARHDLSVGLDSLR